MPAFSAYDGTELAYHFIGEGAPLVCLPGGPMQESAYLGDLGGLSAHRQLVMLDLRGTGRSAVPNDLTSYRCDRQVDDVEALREHLELATLDLLGHSAGTNLAVLYAARLPERVSSLVLVTPSPFAVGISITAETRQAIAQLRKDEPWFPEASAALAAIVAGQAADDDWEAMTPFFYGRWDEVAQTHRAAQAGTRNDDAAAVFGAEDAFDPVTTRAALATFNAPTLLLAGEVDMNSCPDAVSEYAHFFANAQLVVQPDAGHYPWLDDADRFVLVTASFLH